MKDKNMTRYQVTMILTQMSNCHSWLPVNDGYVFGLGEPRKRIVDCYVLEGRASESLSQWEGCIPPELANERLETGRVINAAAGAPRPTNSFVIHQIVTRAKGKKQRQRVILWKLCHFRAAAEILVIIPIFGLDPISSENLIKHLFIIQTPQENVQC